jgi:hypothetical protein
MYSKNKDLQGAQRRMLRRGANVESRFHDVRGCEARNGIRTAPRRPRIAAPRRDSYPDERMKLLIRQAGGTEGLVVGSQKEFLQLWKSGVIAGDDLVQRGEQWVRAADLPWIRGMAEGHRRDSRRLFWITLVLMLLGLAGVLWIQGHAGVVARRSGALPPGAVRAVPR